MSQLILAEQLSQRVKQLSIGMEQGVADLLDMVDPLHPDRKSVV